jgi:hypothetical protein
MAHAKLISNSMNTLCNFGTIGGDFGGIPQVDLKSADCTVLYSIKGNDVFFVMVNYFQMVLDLSTVARCYK